MELIFAAYIAIDDDTRDPDPPFTHNPCIWSLSEDYALSLWGDYQFYAASARE